MGLFKKLKKVVKVTSGIGLAEKARKKGNKLTKKALGKGGKGKHLKAGKRSGGKKAAARNAGPRLAVSRQGNAQRAIQANRKYRRK